MNTPNRYISQLDTDLISLRTLVAIAEEGSFSAAAKRVGRTQSAVSLQISKLEERIGVQLFERTSRKVMVTEAGEKMVSYASKMLDLANEAMQNITEADIHEILRIGFAEYLVPAHLDRLLSRFKKAYPKVELNLNLGSGADLTKDMTGGKLDIVVAGPEFKGGQILMKEPLVWVAAKDFQEKERVPLILMPPPCSYRKAAYDCLTAKNFQFELAMETNSFYGVLSAVSSGLGVSVVAKCAVTENMQILKDIYPKLPHTSMCAYVRPGVSAVLKERFLAFLIEGLSE